MQTTFKTRARSVTISSHRKPDTQVSWARRTHRKSRTGCRNCKLRRVKCDEAEGPLGCDNCCKHGVECDYLLTRPNASQALQRRDSPTTSGSARSIRENSSSSLSPVTTINAEPKTTFSASYNRGTAQHCEQRSGKQISPTLLQPSLRSTFPIQCPPAMNMISPIVALEHFNVFTSHTCGSAMGQGIIRQHALSFAMQTPFLLHAMLGIASAHLAFLLDSSENQLQSDRSKLTEAWHWSKALKLYREQLLQVHRRKELMDSLLSFVMLLALHLFAPRGEVEEQRFVFVENRQKRRAALSWLTEQWGFGLMLRELEGFLEQSVWLPVLLDADVDDILSPKNWAHRFVGSDNDEVAMAFLDLCGVDEASNALDNPYFANLQTLLALRRMRPLTSRDFNKIITFMGRLSPQFKGLLMDRDTAALLILLHWLTLIMEIRQWWSFDRAREESRAIILFLFKREVVQLRDQRVSVLLQEPAKLVGIEIGLPTCDY